MERSEGGRKGHEWRYCPKKTVRERGPRSTAPPTLFYTAVVSYEGGVEVSLNGRGEKSGRRNFPFEEKKVSHPSTLLPVQVFFLLEYRLIPPFAPCLVPFLFFFCFLLTAEKKKARFFARQTIDNSIYSTIQSTSWRNLLARTFLPGMEWLWWCVCSVIGGEER